MHFLLWRKVKFIWVLYRRKAQSNSGYGVFFQLNNSQQQTCLFIQSISQRTLLNKAQYETEFYTAKLKDRLLYITRPVSRRQNHKLLERLYNWNVCTDNWIESLATTTTCDQNAKSTTMCYPKQIVWLVFAKQRHPAVSVDAALSYSLAWTLRMDSRNCHFQSRMRNSCQL